ncbi:putative transcriptional regulator [Nocardia nova SH22a]|uniref:Putative transcriptional regulator n=1 Tax=Nocardia nova SH22a TaxID=1415166 RepID=W5THV0_9NOCA|nr:FCD domain-containing protein [Nocardia nova]AHH18568.1 putative transcriptional regulator [Nocardia nova SH22a]
MSASRDDAAKSYAGRDDDAALEGPAYSREIWSRTTDVGSTVALGGSRAEQAAGQIARLAAAVPAGERIGSKDELRKLCGVSVGTINEAIKLAQTRGIITSRPGPGGGLFACDPSPLSRMNGWFRAAADDSSAFAESVQIRDAIAPLLIDEVLRCYTLADQDALAERLAQVHRAQESGTISDFVWAGWELHAYIADLGKGGLLNTLYLSIMDVGTTYLRAKLETAAPEDIDPTPMARVMEDLVDGLARRDRDAAIDALRRTVPTVVLRSFEPTTGEADRSG